jgi:hypothetical protein
MNVKKTLLLLGLLLLLGIYYYVVEVKMAEEKKLAEEQALKAEREGMKIFPFPPESFTRIKLTTEGKTIIYEKEEGGWAMVEPVKAQGGEDALENLIGTIADYVLETDPVAETPDNLADFGLDQPHTTISVTTREVPKPITLVLGDRSPTNSTFYAQLKGSRRVFLTGTLIQWEMSKEYENLEKRMGPFFEPKEERDS